MNTVTMLEMLLGALESRPRKNAPNQLMTNGPGAPAGTAPAIPATVPSASSPSQQTPTASPLSPQPDPLAQQSQLSANQPLPQPVPPAAPTEANLRSQLDQVDLYDLSGEKAAAQALQREDAFKQQQIDEKAQQTKEFFAEQDRKQQETLHEVQKQADLQVQERSQKEFWDQKQSQEMQAGMDKELRGLHEAARQEHQKWRDDFTQGVCREDVTKQINKQIDDRTMAYHDRLNDIGTNPIDATETVSRYRVQLGNGAQGQIDQQTAALHKEHFSEQQPSGPGHPSDPPGPSSRHPEAEHPETERQKAEPTSSSSADVDQSQKVGKTGPGITYPQGGPQLNIPGYGGREDMRPAPEANQPQQSAGSSSGDSPPPAPPGGPSGAAQADAPKSPPTEAEQLPPLKGHQTRHQYPVDAARYLKEKETEEAAENITEVEEKGHHLHEAFDQAKEAVEAHHEGHPHPPGPDSGSQPPGENLHVLETLAKGPSPECAAPRCPAGSAGARHPARYTRRIRSDYRPYAWV